MTAQQEKYRLVFVVNRGATRAFPDFVRVREGGSWLAVCHACAWVQARSSCWCAGEVDVAADGQRSAARHRQRT